MITVTKASLLFKQDKLRRLQSRREEVSADIDKAKSDGDFKENFGYTEGLRERDMIDTRISELTQGFNDTYQVIEPEIWANAGIPSKVSLGVVVALETRFKAGKPELWSKATYLIGGAWDNDLPLPQEELITLTSYTSPIAQALLGRGAGAPFDGVIGRAKQEIHILGVRPPTTGELDAFYEQEAISGLEQPA